MKKVMILGANGLCGTSLVTLMDKLHKDVEVIAIDPCVEENSRIINATVKTEDLWHVLRSFGLTKGDVLVDLAPELVKLDVMQAADNVGVSCVNATCCEHERGTLGIIDMLDPELLFARYKWQAPHIPSAGMNPGNINALLATLVKKVGKTPVDVTQWEMDSTTPFQWDGTGYATWSPEEFASEFCDESTWEVEGKTVLFADGPPIDNLQAMPSGEMGALCQHEEVILWGWRYGCKARYLYGYPEKQFKAIEKEIRQGLELDLCRKIEGQSPTGTDTIGLKVDFGGQTAEACMSVKNESDLVPVGSNATSYLVACGCATAVQMLKEERKVGIRWPDLYGEKWINFIQGNKLCEVKFERSASLLST